MNMLKALLPHGLVRWMEEKKRGGTTPASFEEQFRRHADLLADGRFSCLWEDRWPCLDDATGNTGFDAHYIFHPAWAARILSRTRPSVHIDIGSSLHFVTLASAFVPVRFYDYRPAHITLPGLECLRGDLLALPFADDSVESLSCMHVVEHVGLGRYGDPIDPHGDLKAMAELTRVVRKGGSLLFVVPVGRQPKIQFNAHRIYSHAMVAGLFSAFSLKQFSLVTDDGEFIEHAAPRQADGQKYGCGCFLFVKN